MLYNWQQKDWLQFRFQQKLVEDAMLAFVQKEAHVRGILKALPGDVEVETIVDTLVAEAIKTSEIEGEYLSRKDVVSSIKKNLGLVAKVQVKDKRAAGIGDLITDMRKTFQQPLTVKKLFEWHVMLMADARGIAIGKWRTGKAQMQIISGAVGKEEVHFVAPPSQQVAAEMKAFVQWFNDTAPDGVQPIKLAPLRSAIAHLYFETIHPFEDGNGRIGRAIAEKAISQTVGHPVLLSLSKTIEAAKKDYYNALKTAQRSNEISAWVNYFVQTILQAQIEAEVWIDFTLQKVKFFDRFKEKLNERQQLVLKRMFDEGPAGFKGGMNARKYMSLTKTSKATATRDLQMLAELNALVSIGAGRNTNYALNV
jgi:Fic family protein